jgi:hypothetical protein
MVGDAVWDMIAARRAGIRGIGLPSGGIAEGELREPGAIEIYADAAALLGKISASVIGQPGGSAPGAAGVPGTAGYFIRDCRVFLKLTFAARASRSGPGRRRPARVTGYGHRVPENSACPLSGRRAHFTSTH